MSKQKEYYCIDCNCITDTHKIKDNCLYSGKILIDEHIGDGEGYVCVDCINKRYEKKRRQRRKKD